MKELITASNTSDVAMLLVIIYLCIKIVDKLLPYVTNNTIEKMDKILVKLDDVVEKLNLTITNQEVHNVRIEHIEEDVKLLQEDVKELKEK